MIRYLKYLLLLFAYVHDGNYYHNECIQTDSTYIISVQMSMHIHGNFTVSLQGDESTLLIGCENVTIIRLICAVLFTTLTFFLGKKSERDRILKVTEQKETNIVLENSWKRYRYTKNARKNENYIS